MPDQTDQRSTAEPTPDRLTLAGEIGIERVGELKETIAAALDRQGGLVIDCQGVTAVDLASLQLFCSAHRTAARRQRQLTLIGCRDDVFGQTIEAAGFPLRHPCPHAPDDEICFWKPIGKSE